MQTVLQHMRQPQHSRSTAARTNAAQPHAQPQHSRSTAAAKPQHSRTNRGKAPNCKLACAAKAASLAARCQHLVRIQCRKMPQCGQHHLHFSIPLSALIFETELRWWCVHQTHMRVAACLQQLAGCMQPGALQCHKTNNQPARTYVTHTPTRHHS